MLRFRNLSAVVRNRLFSRMRWLLIAGGFALFVIVMSIPYLVRFPVLRDAILSRCVGARSQSLRMTDLTIGWNSPVEMRGIYLKSGNWEIRSPKAYYNRSLWALITNSNRLGTLKLIEPQVRWVQATAAPARKVSKRTITAKVNKPSSLALSFAISRGTFVVVRDGKTTLIARNITGEARTDSQSRLTYRFTADAGPKNLAATVKAEGTVRWPARSPSDLLQKGDWVFRDWNLAYLSSFARRFTTIPLPPLDLMGQTNGRVAFDRSQRSCSWEFDVSGFHCSSPSVSWAFREPKLRIRGKFHQTGTHTQFKRLAAAGHEWSVAGAGQITEFADRTSFSFSGNSRQGNLQSGIKRFLKRFKLPVLAEPEGWSFEGEWFGPPLASDSKAVLRMEQLQLLGTRFGPFQLEADWNARQLSVASHSESFFRGKFEAISRISFDQNLPQLRVQAGRVAEQAYLETPLARKFLRNLDPALLDPDSFSGRVSLDLIQLQLPLTLPHGNKLRGHGRVTLREVTFRIGPLLRNILIRTGIDPSHEVEVNDEVDIWVQPNEFRFAGLNLDSGNEQVELNGRISYDHGVELWLDLPVTSKLLGADPLLLRLLAGERVILPVRGSLASMKIQDADVAAALNRTIQRALARKLTGQATKFLGTLTRITGADRKQ